MPERKCTVCGCVFEGRVDARYCSDRCRQQGARDRGTSATSATIGGLSTPVLRFTATSGAFGEVGTARVELAGLRGEPQRDRSGHIPVELRVGDIKLWAGDLTQVARGASRTTCVRVAGPEARLVSQMWGPGTWEGLAAQQFAAGCALRADFACMPSEAPLDSRRLGTILDINGAASAADLLRSVVHEQGLALEIQDGTLYIRRARPTEPRTIDARDVQVIDYVSENEHVAVIVRSQAPSANGALLSSSRVADVAPATAVYVITCTGGARQVEIDMLSEQLTRELGAQVIHVSARIDYAAGPVSVGDRVTIEQAGDVSLRVSRIEHCFTAEAGLSTRVEAMFLPLLQAVSMPQRSPPPRIIVPAWAAAAPPRATKAA